MIKLANGDEFTYINKNKISVISSYKDEGFETDTMSKAIQYTIEIVLDDDTVITNQTTNKKEYLRNIRCLENHLDINDEDKL